MQVIGLLGGIASGKSTVAELLRRRGAEILDADRVGHDVLELPEVRAALEQRWGQGVLDADRRISRPAVARIVFGGGPRAAEELAFLEQITHPRIQEHLRRQLVQYQRQATAAVVLDAPVLLKAGWHVLCTHLVYVDAPQAMRLRRVQQRGWNEADFNAREAAQESLDAKRAAADWIIDNSGSTEATAAQVERFWQTHVANQNPS